jgi:hypothetical protein
VDQGGVPDRFVPIDQLTAGPEATKYTDLIYVTVKTKSNSLIFTLLRLAEIISGAI